MEVACIDLIYRTRSSRARMYELCGLFLLTVVSPLPIDVHPILENHPYSSTALRIRLLPSALSYLNEIASEFIANQLPRLFISNIKHRFSNEQGTAILSNVRVSRFRRATKSKVSAMEPNKISWTMQNLDIGMIGELSGEVNVVVPFELEGEAEIQARGVDFYLQSAVEKSLYGSTRLLPLSCRTYIKAIQIENHNGGIAGVGLNLFKTAISNHIKPLIQTQICKKVTKFIDEDLNTKLSQVQTETTLVEALRLLQFGPKNSSINSRRFLNDLHFISSNTTDNFIQQLSSIISIDYRLSESPKCYKNMVELANLGAISSKKPSLQTPFEAAPLNWPNVTNWDSMMQILVSDYIINALLYHSFKKQLLNFAISASTMPSLQSFLQTSCPNSFCLADILPELSEKYANNEIQLLFSASRAPVVLLRAEEHEPIMSNLNGLVYIYIKNNSRNFYKQVAVLGIDIVASNILKLRNNTLIGSLNLKSFRLKNKFGSLDLSDDELSDVALLSSEILQKFLNGFLATGFPLPIPEAVKLAVKDMKIVHRSAIVFADFALDYSHIKNIALKTIFNSTFLKLP